MEWLSGNSLFCT